MDEPIQDNQTTAGVQAGRDVVYANARKKSRRAALSEEIATTSWRILLTRL
jgi:hypothetical protein